MQCPNGDGELISHTTQGENNLTVSYSTCPACRGHWTTPFSANFINLPSEDAAVSGPPGVTPACPVCTKQLIRATGENIPDNALVYTCPDSHGYFFPAGQLAAFKKAQKSKIEYHKLWNLPLPKVSSVLLAGVMALVLTGGLVVGLQSVQKSQTSTSQASGLIRSQNAFISPSVRSVLISAKTDYNTDLTVHIPSMNNFESALKTTDSLTHTVTVKNVPGGTHRYYFTLTFSGETVQTDTYTFVMP